jgi:hypothetical protein
MNDYLAGLREVCPEYYEGKMREVRRKNVLIHFLAPFYVSAVLVIFFAFTSVRWIGDAGIFFGRAMRWLKDVDEILVRGKDMTRVSAKHPPH